ncbi:MAG: DUF4258 domain-containing protein [Dehalococcoidia bacterium]
MAYEIIPLALKKIARRRVPMEWIEETLNSPEQIVEGYEGRQVAQKLYQEGDKKMLLRIVFEPEKDKWVVVTACITSQIEKYWRQG